MHRNRRLKNNITLKKAGVVVITLVLFFGILMPSASSQFGLFLNKDLKNSFSIINEFNVLTNDVNPLVLDGKIEDLYLTHGKHIYYGNLNYENASGNLYVVDNTSIDSEYVWIAWVLNPFYVDNTYGNGTVPQYRNVNGHPITHSFEDLNESDMQEIKLYNTNNNLAFYASMDVIDTVANTPSGYGVPPWGSGESQVFYGDSSLVEYETSLAFNVNHYINTGPYNVLTDSPTIGDQNYTPYPGYELWEHRTIFELRVNRSLFGGQNINVSATELPDLHASPNKIGPHYIPLTPIYMPTLIINIVGNGQVIKNPDQTTYTYGTVVELTANPGTGWSFSHWSGDITGSSNPEYITMDSDKTVTAHFTINEYTLTINIIGNGQVTKFPDQNTYAYGTLVKLTAYPDAGSNFDHWSGDLTGSINPELITMDSNKAVTAHFIQLIPNLYCDGSLSWTCSAGNTVNGNTVTGNFTVENIGDPNSLLNWEIIEWPEWGQWSFNPSHGDNLMPEEGSINVEVIVIKPTTSNLGFKAKEFTGEVKIVNNEDSNDYCTIPAYLKIQRSKTIISPFLNSLQNLIQNYPNMFPILQMLLTRLGLQ
jgi:hypothetical protein